MGRGGGIDGPHTPSVRDQRLACGRAMHAGCLTEMRRRRASARRPLCRAAHPKQWLPVVVGYPPGCIACAFFKERLSKTRRWGVGGMLHCCFAMPRFASAFVFSYFVSSIQVLGLFLSYIWLVS